MADNEEKDESNGEAEDLFRQQSEILPVREDEENESDGDGAEQALEERMDGARKLTDFQTLSNILNPDFGYRHLNLVAKGRTFPDVYNPILRMLVKDLIKRDLSLSVTEAYAIANTALSKSIDGEGIIDNIVAYTKGHQETTSEQNKTIGIGG